MYLFIYLFIYIKIYNKGGKTHWRLAGRCPLGVSVCRRHWNCVSMASGYELTSKHTQNQLKKKKKRYLCMYLFVYLFIYLFIYIYIYIIKYIIKEGKLTGG